MTPPTRRSGSRAVLVIAIALVLAGAAGIAAAVVVAPTPPVAPVEISIEALPAEAPTIAWPDSKSAGVAAVGIEGSLAVAGSDESHPMASLTKIVTVLVVLEHHPIEGDSRGAAITMGPDDVQAVSAAIADNAPVVPVSVGTVVSQRDLIERTLVRSSANAAWSLANWAFGSMDAFLSAAEDFADRHDLQGTELADAAGLDARSVSSARDLTKVMLMAADTPAALETMQLESIQLPGGGFGVNTNRILGLGDIDAGKTGTLRIWGRNLAVMAERIIDGQPRRTVAVIMGTIAADEIDAQMLALVESLWDDFHEHTVIDADTVVARYEAPWGAATDAATTQPIAVSTFGDVVPVASATSNAAQVADQRRVVGDVAVEFGDERYTVPVRTVGALPAPELSWRFAHPLEVLSWYRTGRGG